MERVIGKVKVTRVREMTMAVSLQMICLNADEQVIARNADWLAPFINPDGSLGMSIHAFVIDTGDKVILVDPCIGCHLDPEAEQLVRERRDFLPDLAEAGYRVEDIDIVLCTHLHFDHVGWNTRLVDGRWVPTFLNARYLFGRVEYAHWAAQTDGPVANFETCVRPIVDAGRADLVEMDHRICDEVWLEPSPGHSPGHVLVHIASNGETALITGDIIHHPVQIAAPHWHGAFDNDPALAVTTRTRVFDQVANTDTRIFGTHFRGASSGLLSRTGAGTFRYDE